MPNSDLKSSVSTLQKTEKLKRFEILHSRRPLHGMAQKVIKDKIVYLFLKSIRYLIV